MVDYVAVLRRTIDALPRNTPDIRERVYAKARQTVQSKLAMINPAPSEALVAKQMSGLETAIATVEADFAVALETAPMVQETDPLADILNGLPNVRVSTGRDKAKDASRDAMSIVDAFSEQPEVRPAVKSELPPQPATPVNQADAVPFELPVVQQQASRAALFPFDMPDLPDRPRLPETATLEIPELPIAAKRTTDSFDDVFGDSAPAIPPRVAYGLPPLPSLDDPVVPPQFTRPVRPKAKPGRMLMPLLGLAVIAGAGALAWTERDRIIAFLKPVQEPIVAVQTETAGEPTAEPTTEPATTVPAEAPATQPAATETPAPQKFTQRLNADGTEVDAGAGNAGGEQSVAQLEPAAEPATPVAPTTPAVEPPAADTPAVDPATPPAVTPAETPAETPVVTPPTAEIPVTPAETTTPAEAIAVGQKAIFYEERTSGSEGSARVGAVVWSVVRESPGNDRPPEPAVRGELTIPEVGLNVRMTLRRNADATLPASHILELIMTVPEDFAGGTIEDVQRVNLKPSEESAGAPLAATPVKVADKFFLVALENAPAAIESNLKLLRDQSWIDLPVVYRTGRRALFTMEKGLVGDQVFKQVLDAWVAAPLQ